MSSQQNLHNIEDKSILPSLLPGSSASSTQSTLLSTSIGSTASSTTAVITDMKSKASRRKKKESATVGSGSSVTSSVITSTSNSKGDSLSVPERGNTFQGGSWKDLHDLLGINVGHEILYVGDHMFSDILR